MKYIGPAISALPRAKILSCIQKGGIPDEDAPTDPASTRYWCTLVTSQDLSDEHVTQTKVEGVVNPLQAVAAMRVGQAGLLGRAAAPPLPDPMAMINEQMSSAASSAGQLASGMSLPASAPKGPTHVAK